MSKSPKQKSAPLLLPAPSSSFSRFFPHYTRLIAAHPFWTRVRRTAGFLFWLLLAGTITINIIALRGTGRLFVSIPFLADTPAVLGESVAPSPSDVPDRGKLEKLYAYWLEVLQSNPDYRDAHVQAALIAFQLGNKEALITHLSAIKEIDPNFEGISLLEALVRSQ